METEPKSSLEKEVIALRFEVERLQKQLEDERWANEKANNGVRALYRELHKANAKLKRFVSQDLLTGLLNRRGFESAWNREQEVARRYDHDLFIILIDLDDFKRINDRYSHSTGDILLKQAAERILLSTRPEDYVARIGGDEFVVMLRKSSHKAALKVAERIRLAVAQTTMTSMNDTVGITCSGALMSFKSVGMPLDAMLAKIHLLLRKSKDEGKNRVSSERSLRSVRRAIADDIRDPEKISNAIRVVRQPIVQLQNQNILGYEYLSRFDFDEIGMPDVFFQHCHENNMLNTVDLACFKKCVQGTEGDSGGKHHMNIFLSTLLDLYPEKISDLLPGGAEANRYCIEISEQQIIGDSSNLLEIVKALKKEGAMVAIDDVGFGRSCLENLLIFQPDVVKIDKSCIIGLSEDKNKQRHLKRLLKVLGSVTFQIIAEGIETQDDSLILQDMGVRYGQGFLFGRPAALTPKY